MGFIVTGKKRSVFYGLTNAGLTSSDFATETSSGLCRSKGKGHLCLVTLKGLRGEAALGATAET